MAERLTLTHAEALEAILAMTVENDPIPSAVTRIELARSKGWSKDRAGKWLAERVAEGKLREVETVRLDSRGRKQRIRGWEPVAQ